MKNSLLGTLILLLTSPFFNTQAQQQTIISGTVTDTQGKPLPGVSVRLLNTNIGTITLPDGNFTIPTPPGTYSVEFANLGYASHEKTIIVTSGGETELKVQLAANTTQLDDVVVTAQKIEEIDQTVPLTVTALSGRQVQEYRLWNAKDLTAIVPNLFSSNPGDNRNITSIRGVTSTSYDPAVATYIDGVNQFGLDTYIPQLLDVERIEILRGPQGTLYGRNAMGGVINIITRHPNGSLSTPSFADGFIEASVGNYGQERYTAGFRAPISKRLYVGISGVYDKTDGFYTNDYTNSKFDRKTNIIGNYYLNYLAGNWTMTLNLKHSQNSNHGAFPLSTSISDALQNPYKVNQNAVTEMVDNLLNSSLSLSYHGNGFNFTSQTAFQMNYRYYKAPIDGDFSPIDGVTIIDNYGKQWNRTKVFTEEFRFTSSPSSSSPLKWTVGTYIFHQESPVKQATRFGEDAMLLGVGDSLFSIINTTKSRSTGGALFGQATFSITDRLGLVAGMRYDYEHKQQSVLGEYQHDPDPNPAFETRPDTSASTSFHAFSPKVGASYAFSDKQSLYFTYSRGFRPGGFTQLSSDPSQPPLYSYKPEYSGSAELGFKNTLFNNLLRVNFTAFYITISDAQVPTLVLPDAFTVTRNTGSLTNQGLELEVASTPVKGLSIEYNAGYTHSRYSKLSVPQNGSVVDLSGKKQLFTPDATSMLALQYGIPFSHTGEWRVILRGEWMYVGKKYFDLANSIDQPAYNTLNTRFGVSGKGFEIMAWVRNLTDKRYVDYAYDFGAAHLGNPRNFGVTIRKNFHANKFL